jgi:all-trans-retinol dehydrogenase (NAD+)
MLVTGAGSGLGRLIAQRAAAQGANLVLWDLDHERLELVERQLRTPTTTSVHAMVVDVSDRPAVAAAAATLRALSVPVDILVNNAGIVSGRRLLDLTDEQIQATFAVNVLALYWTTRAFLPDMVARRRGHIATIASAAGLVGVSRQTDYAASKHAAVGFDESLRYELRRMAPSIVTTVVCPFYVDTGMFRGVKSRWPRLLPILEQEYVADRVIRAIRRNERRVILPPLVRLVPVARLLPVPLFDALINLFGVNVGMDEFIGREARREDPALPRG